MMRKSVRAWLIVAIASSAVLPLLVVGTILVVRDLNVQQWQTLSQQRQVSESVSMQVSALVSEVSNILAGLTRVTRFQEMSQGERHTVLNEMLAYQDVDWRFERFIVLDALGRQQLQVTPQGMFSGADLADHSESDMFAVPRTSAAPYYHLSVSSDHAGESGDLELTVAVPIFDLNTAAAEPARSTTAAFVDGVVVAEVSVQAVQDMFGILQPDDALDSGRGLGRGESVYIINEHGQVLAAYPPELLSELSSSDSEGEPMLSFEVPEQQGLQRGIGGNRAILAVVPVALGTQTLHVIAEKSLYTVLVPTMFKVLVILGTLILALIVAGMLVVRSQRHIVQPLETLAMAAQKASSADISKQEFVFSLGIGPEATGESPSGVAGYYEEIRDLAYALSSMVVRLRTSIGDLERRLVVRTDELERRSLQLDAVAQIARGAAEMPEVDQLLDEAVDLIADHFGFRHVGIFLLDEGGEYAVLRAASSKAGRSMVARGYRKAVGDGEAEADLVAQVARYGEPRLAFGHEVELGGYGDSESVTDGGEAALVLPLKARGEILGVLVYVSDSGLGSAQKVFSEEEVVVLQTLADQVAMAVSNLTLYQQAQEGLEIIQRAYGQLSQENWKALLQVQGTSGGAAPSATMPELESSGGSAVPAGVRENMLRNLKAMAALQMDEAEDIEDVADKSALIGTLMDQLAVALHSARLYQDTQRHAAREQLIREVTARMQETLDMDLMLKTAVQDIQEALNLSEVTVRLAPRSADDGIGLATRRAEAGTPQSGSRDSISGNGE